MKLRFDHPARLDNRTLFPSRVRSAERGENVLKGGAGNSKIGGNIIHGGKWDKFRVLTCTNEERRTCPKMCIHRGDCYGNNMRFAVRYNVDNAFYREVERQLRVECVRPVALRLKVLGDFTDLWELVFWRHMLGELPNLHIWGFTAWREAQMAAVLTYMRLTYPDRWKVRTSGAGDVPWAANSMRSGPGLICPHYKTGIKCVFCGMCWESSQPIRFPDH